MKASHFVGLVSHGELSCAIKNVIEKLLPPSGIVYCYSNQTESLETIESTIVEDISQSGAQHILIMVDLVGGSCWLLANRLKKTYPKAVAMGGMNVPMVISFLMNYEQLEWEQLIEKVTEDGRKGIIGR